MWYNRKDKETYYGTLYFNIRNTQFFLDTAKNSLKREDIECYLQHNDDPYIKMYDRYYYIRKPINVGDVFRLKVCHPDYPTFMSEVVVPDLYDVDIKIEFTGLRPGEKLYEELLMAEEGMKETANKLIHIGKPIEMDDELFKSQLLRLEAAYKEEVENMKDIVAYSNRCNCIADCWV